MRTPQELMALQERGGIFIRQAIERAGIAPSAMPELAARAECTERELMETYHGRGHVGGLPEPRVLHGICRELECSYKGAMVAFGHLI